MLPHPRQPTSRTRSEYALTESKCGPYCSEQGPAQSMHQILAAPSKPESRCRIQRKRVARPATRSQEMPLYDCLLLAKPQVRKEALMDLMARVGGRVYQRNGVITEIKSFGTVQLGYGIKKLDGRHYQGQLMQMTMMVPPTFNQELQYLNKEDRLLRWLVVKHRNTLYGLEFINEDEGKKELNTFRGVSLFPRGDETDDDEEYDDSSDEDGDGDEYDEE